MFKDIHLTAQRNDSKFEGVGSKKRPQKVFLAFMIAKNTFSRGFWHPTPSNFEKFL